MNTRTRTMPTPRPKPPADRQASRARTWTVELMSAPAFWAGRLTVDAPTREDAWTAAYALAANYNAHGGETVPQGVSLAPMTKTEDATVHAFLSGRSVRLRADRASGLDSIEHNGGRVYVHEIHVPRDLDAIGVDLFAAAGDALDKYRRRGPALSQYYSEAEREACAIRCAAHDVPEAFESTGTFAVWAWWRESTSPRYPSLVEAHRVARLHGGGRASLRLDGVTIATMHNAHAATSEHGPALLRVLPLDVAAEISPRAARIITAMQSIATMGHPDTRPEIEYAYTPAELDHAHLDPRDDHPAPVLREIPPNLGEIYPELDDVHAQLRAESLHWQIASKLRLNPERLWEIAERYPAHFDHAPTASAEGNR